MSLTEQLLHPTSVSFVVCCFFARGAAAAIIVYDVTSADSFTRAKNWVKELQRTGNANVVLAVAGMTV